MLMKTFSALVHGIDAIPITIETDISKGLPSYQVIGHPDTSIKESKERLRLAFNYSGFSYPKGRVTINMSPADLYKRGSHFDLAIAVGILAATDQIQSETISQYCFLGELSLDGCIHGTKGVLPMVSSMKKIGIQKVIVPKENIKEALLVPDIEVYGIKYLEEVKHHFNSIIPMLPAPRSLVEGLPSRKTTEKDFSDVKGQEYAKRAITISVAGGHGLLLMGSPSTGKTMLSERIPGIMPEMTIEEKIETTKIYSVAGMLNENIPIISSRPFRHPHHKLTVAGLLGGGTIPKPGEISLANKGVLFLDEIGEFDYRLMDALRIPLETKEMILVRKNMQYIYPADFLLVAASNPCPCGYLGDSLHQCKCSASEILRYQRKFSGPIMDRIDMHVHLMPIAYEELICTNTISSQQMREQIETARSMQKKRYEKLNISLNHQLDESNIEHFAALPENAEFLLAEAYEKMKLNPRTLLKVRKLARTIADLEEKDEIMLQHVTEALQYRGNSHER